MIALLWLLGGCAGATGLVGSASVTDGDTLEIGGVRVRLFGVDAPEKGQLCAEAGGRSYPCGGRAANALDVAVRGRTVRCEAKDQDRYGRTVAVCRVDGVDVGALLVRAGWALAYRQYSRDYVDEEDAARADRAGMWSGAFTAPWDFRHGDREVYAPLPVTEASTCCRVCTNSQPCGDACIPNGSTCRSARGCACAR